MTGPDRLSTVPESLWMDVYRDVIRPDYFPPMTFTFEANIEEIAANIASQAVDHFIAKFPEWQDDKQAERSENTDVGYSLAFVNGKYVFSTPDHMTVTFPPADFREFVRMATQSESTIKSPVDRT